MTTSLVPFDFDGQPIRTITIDTEPWFVVRDVCQILGIGNPSQAISYLDEDEKGVITNETLGGPQQVGIVNESGLYSLILRSRKPEAKAFKKWITSVLLPTIRKTGSYQAPQSREEVMALGLRAAHELIEEKEQRIAELEPKARTFDTFLNSTGDYSVNEAAKVLSRDHDILTGEHRLFAFMEKAGWIYRDGKNKPIPYQAQVNNGRLVAKSRFHYHPETGEVVIDAPQIRITAKGLEALRAKHLEAKASA